MASIFSEFPTIQDVIAIEGTRAEIPLTKTRPGQLSINEGFPPETAERPQLGGIPPQRPDMNGALYEVSKFGFAMQSGAGAGYPWFAEFDYIPGCTIMGSNGVKYRCMVASGPNYGGPRNPTISGNSYNWGDQQNGRPWLNEDSAYQSVPPPVDISGLAPTPTTEPKIGQIFPIEAAPPLYLPLEGQWLYFAMFYNAANWLVGSRFLIVPGGALITNGNPDVTFIHGWAWRII